MPIKPEKLCTTGSPHLAQAASFSILGNVQQMRRKQKGMTMMRLYTLAIKIITLLLLATPGLAQQTTQQPAKELFGAKHTASSGPETVAGFYSKGCIGGAVQLPANGPGWQAMRLSRDRRWGSAALVSNIKALAQAVVEDGFGGILVGDMSQARGGPMLTGHASHQIGLDADIWLLNFPAHTLSAKERENLSAISAHKKGANPSRVDPKKFGERQRMLIYRAANLPGVARIFVHPAIKKALCQINWRDRSFLSRVRPWYGHHYHFHIRMNCPEGSDLCKNQAPPPPGDGCGAPLDYWFTEAPYKPRDPNLPPKPPKPPITLADLPKACAAVLEN